MNGKIKYIIYFLYNLETKKEAAKRGERREGGFCKRYKYYIFSIPLSVFSLSLTHSHHPLFIWRIFLMIVFVQHQLTNTHTLVEIWKIGAFIFFSLLLCRLSHSVECRGFFLFYFIYSCCYFFGATKSLTKRKKKKRRIIKKGGKFAPPLNNLLNRIHRTPQTPALCSALLLKW